jgi:subtilase family serine protease
MRLRYLQTTSIVTMALMLAGVAAASPTDGVDKVVKAPGGYTIIPHTSQPHPEDPSQVHTNFEFFSRTAKLTPLNTTTTAAGYYETPASLACIYGLTAKSKQCNPKKVKTVATGGSRAIAIVDVYDDPTAEADLNTYSKHFGLPAVTSDNFQIIYADGKQPDQDPTGGWETEEQLDIEMAHAMAPGAKIILVEAKSPSLRDLALAEVVAIKAVQAAGGGEVSNSWGSYEYPDEASLTPSFAGDNVVVFAAAGDTPGVSVPAVLHNVVAVGGTTIFRSYSGAYLEQGTWNFGGGGISSYIPVPSYQSGTPSVSAVVGKWRGTPDVSFDSNNFSGVWIYDSTPYQGSVLQWVIVGGTSAASPAVAGIVNSAGKFNASTRAELTELYAKGTKAADYSDITVGQCANDDRGRAVKGYDLCTGVGTPFGNSGK